MRPDLGCPRTAGKEYATRHGDHASPRHRRPSPRTRGHDAVLGEGQSGVVGVDRAAGVGVALQVIAAVGAAEQLLAEGALEGVAADLELDPVAGERGQHQEAKSPGG